MDLEKYTDWLRRRNCARSVAPYTRVIRRYLDDPSALEARMVDQEYSPNYRRHLVACVRSWAHFINDGELLIKLKEIRLPAAIPVSSREPFTWDQWWTIQDTIKASELDDGLRFVCSLIALRGIRCGDVLRLRRSEITAALDDGALAFEGKGERRTEYHAEPLREHLQGLADLQWGSSQRVYQLISPSADTASRAVRRAFDQIAGELGMDPAELYAHRFRHTYAYYFLQELAGDPEAVFKLQAQMGWARLETAASYMRRDRRTELNEIESRMLSGRKAKGDV